ncbi:TPA: hypothetical protein ACRI62_005742 [Klebsiella michiganensis]
MTTDITELAQSLKRRATSANEFGESLYVKADDVISLVEALEKAENTAGVAGMAESYETTISMLKSRISELEESHAQVIQSRDHYKRMTEEGLKQLAESRTVKLPHLPDDCDRADANFYYMKALADAGIKWEAE